MPDAEAEAECEDEEETEAKGGQLTPLKWFQQKLDKSGETP